jgi:hypothetical protein
MGLTFRFNSYRPRSKQNCIVANHSVAEIPAVVSHIDPVLHQTCSRGQFPAPIKRMFTIQSQYGCAYRHLQIFTRFDLLGNTHQQTGIHHFSVYSLTCTARFVYHIFIP